MLAAAAGLCAAGAQAQFVSSPTVISSPTAALPGLSLGVSVPMDHGPWVLGEVLFFSSGKMVSDYTWRDRVRGTRGALYTKADISSDVESLMNLGRFDKVVPNLFEIPGTPVPAEFATIAASTSQVRLVFSVVEKAVAASSTTARRALAPAPVSGVIMTPTAYRGAGKFDSPGLGLDFTAMYVIGRLYGRNNFLNAPTRTNYLDRVGVWLLTADGKMQIQSEGPVRPAVAVGGQGTFMFRDSPQPNVNDPNPTLKVNASQKSTKLFSDAYVAVSKKFGPARTTVGLMEGNMGDSVANFTEFLTPDALRFFAGQNGQTVRSRTMPFASVMFMPKPQYPLAIEYIQFNGAALHPIMINLKMGYFLHLNFDVGIVKFNGGYDVLGLLQFRYNQFPNK